jgi:hypothetical protein
MGSLPSGIEKENIAFQSENFWHEVKAYLAGFGQA